MPLPLAKKFLRKILLLFKKIRERGGLRQSTDGILRHRMMYLHDIITIYIIYILSYFGHITPILHFTSLYLSEYRSTNKNHQNMAEFDQNFNKAEHL